MTANRLEVNSPTRTVSVDAIAQELGRVWGDIAQQVEQQTDQIPLHTSILNLVVVATGRLELRQALSTLHQLVGQLPSRAIVIEISPPGTPLDATISAHCQYLENGHAACYEVIEIRTARDRLDAVPSLLVPLELYDVPSVMWWTGGFQIDAPQVRRLLGSAERVIIDSSRFDVPLDALHSFQRFLRLDDTACTGADLDWSRITSWRELIAQTFDHPVARPLLHQIQRVDLSFDPVAEPQGYLLAGWLASRLGWTLQSAVRETDTVRLRLRDPHDGDVFVNLDLQASAGVGLRSVRMLAGSGTNAARISVRRRSEDLVVVGIETAGMPRQDRVLRDTQPALHELIGRELIVHGRDRVFDESLDLVASVVDLLGTGSSQRI